MKRSRADDEEEVVPSIASKRTRDDEEEIVPSTSSASASAGGHDNEEYASESKDTADDNIGGSRTPVCVCL